MSIKFKLTEPTIGLQDRTGLLSLADSPVSFTLQRGSRGTATVVLQIAASSSYTVEIGWPAFIYEIDDASPVTETCVFAGTVDTVQWDWQGNGGYHTLTLTLVSLEQCLDTILVDPPISYFGKTAGFIVADLLSKYASGVPVTAGTISAGITESAAVYDHERLSDIFDTLATDCGFIWYVDPATRQLMFCASTTTDAPFTLDSSQVLWGSLEWLQTRQDFRNRQTVRCAFEALGTRIERFTNTGSAQTSNVSLAVADIRAAWIETDGAVASVVGTFTGQPDPDDTVTIDSIEAYKFVAALDNTKTSQVLIGATAADTLQNLIDAINVNPLTAGIGFSLPTVWNGGFIAGEASGLSFTLYDRVSGTGGNAETVASSATNFSWAASTLSGGSNPSSSVQLDLSKDVSFTKGDTEVNLLTGQTGDYFCVMYYPIGQDCISVEDTTLVTSMAATENGTGKYQQIEDDSQLADIVVAYNRALGKLNAFKTLPVSFSFQTDSSFLSVGQLLPVALTKPTGASFIDGDYVVQEIEGTLIPGMDHFRYTVTVINATEVGTHVKFFEAMAGSSSGGRGGGGGGAGSGLSQGGELGWSLVTTTPYSVQPSDEVLRFGSGASVVNLPSSAAVSRHVLRLLNRSGADLALNAASGDTIEGGSSLTLPAGSSFEIVSDS
jgi:hypothetical protein